MENNGDEVKKTQLVEARARNISHNVRCTECGSQSIEDSQADIAILLRKVDSISLALLISLVKPRWSTYSLVYRGNSNQSLT